MKKLWELIKKYWIITICTVIFVVGLILLFSLPDPEEVVPELAQTPENSVCLVITSSGIASGVVVSEDGIVLTASHVVKNDYLEGITPPVKIIFPDGREYTEFEHFYADEHVDVAYFRIKDVKKLPHLKFGDLREMRVGDEIWAIGMPFGLTWWHSYGYLSKDPEKGKIFMDISLNPGNSGCPILNMKDEIIGVCTGGILPGNDMSLGHTGNICEAILVQYRYLFDLYE